MALHWRKAHGSALSFSGGGGGWETFNRTSNVNLALPGNCYEGWLAQELKNVAQS